MKDFVPDVLVLAGALLLGAALALLLDWRWALGWFGLLLFVLGLALARRG